MISSELLLIINRTKDTDELISRIKGYSGQNSINEDFLLLPVKLETRFIHERGNYYQRKTHLLKQILERRKYEA